MISIGGYLDMAILTAGAVLIILYATWLLVHRLRRGDSPRKSFLTWLKHLFEAVMGL